MRGIIPITAVFSDSLLKPTLDRLYADFNYPDSATDPIQIVRRYDGRRPRSRRVLSPRRWRSAAWRACCSRSSGCWRSMGRGRRLTFGVRARSDDAGIRRHRPPLDARARSRRAAVAAAADARPLGSIEGFFLEGYDPRHADITEALDSFSARALALDLRRPTAACRDGRACCYFFPRPSAGSGCKRLNLFLRWMVRRDALDLGVWSRVAPAQADRAARHARHPRRPLPAADALHQPGLARWRATSPRRCARLDPDDPVKYDFALCHLGMMNACGFNRAQADAQCPLRGACRPRVS